MTALELVAAIKLNATESGKVSLHSSRAQEWEILSVYEDMDGDVCIDIIEKGMEEL